MSGHLTRLFACANVQCAIECVHSQPIAGYCGWRAQTLSDTTRMHPQKRTATASQQSKQQVSTRCTPQEWVSAPLDHIVRVSRDHLCRQLDCFSSGRLCRVYSPVAPLSVSTAATHARKRYACVLYADDLLLLLFLRRRGSVRQSAIVTHTERWILLVAGLTYVPQWLQFLAICEILAVGLRTRWLLVQNVVVCPPGHPHTLVQRTPPASSGTAFLHRAN